MPVNQYSRLTNCTNCRREVNLVRDIENSATPKASNWLCPNCGHRTLANQNLAFVAYEMSTPDKVANGTMNGNWTLATPDTGGYNSVIKP